jgi:hypothetical protein
MHSSLGVARSEFQNPPIMAMSTNVIMPHSLDHVGFLARARRHSSEKKKGKKKKKCNVQRMRRKPRRVKEEKI